jgi:TM2 domain-containing membrane protein YozV
MPGRQTRHSSGVLISPKSYAVAVCLSGIFGILGVQHFYLGRPLTGVIDVGMTAAFVFFFATGETLWGGVFLAADFAHSLVVTIQLLVGSYRDGDGAVVAYPGQFKGR